MIHSGVPPRGNIPGLGHGETCTGEVLAAGDLEDLGLQEALSMGGVFGSRTRPGCVSFPLC